FESSRADLHLCDLSVRRVDAARLDRFDGPRVLRPRGQSPHARNFRKKRFPMTAHPSVVSTKEPVLAAKGVNAYFGGFHAVKSVSLNVEPNTVTALIGPSGCGKSTFLRTLNRLHAELPGARFEGQVLLEGENIYARGMDAVQVRRKIGMVFQKPNPFPALSIYENVVVGLTLAGVRDRKLLDETAERALRHSALWDEVKDKLRAPGTSLSGGQQQRLCIA